MPGISSRLKFRDRNYVEALFVCSLFLCASLAAASFDPENTGVIAYIGLAYFIFAGVAAIRLIDAGGGLSALPFFLIGTAIFFGLGTYASVYEPEANNYFTVGEQKYLLAKVNLVNALSVFLVVLFAGLQGRRPAGETSSITTGTVLVSLRPWLPIMLVLSVPCHALAWITFPHLDDGVLHSLLRLTDVIPLFSVFVGAAIFQRISPLERFVIATLIVFYFSEGMLSLSKRTMLSPILAFGTGLWVGGYFKKTAIALFSIAVVAYFLLLTAIVPLGRAHVMYDQKYNSIIERAQIIQETVSNLPRIDHAYRRRKALARLSPTQFSAFFILSHDLGSPGNSISLAHYVVIPRILWPEKPLISPGKDFDTIWRGSEASSGLGIGYPAEAYWNFGWIGVVLISTYLGLIIGWFSRRWFAFLSHGVSYIGIFVFGPWIIRNLLIVESNIVGNFFGGMMKIAILILLLDFGVRIFLSLRTFADAQDALAHPALVSPGPRHGIRGWIENRRDLDKFYVEAQTIYFSPQVAAKDQIANPPKSETIS